MWHQTQDEMLEEQWAPHSWVRMSESIPVQSAKTSLSSKQSHN